jgi:hypothetical protein
MAKEFRVRRERVKKRMGKKGNRLKIRLKMEEKGGG